MNETTNNNKKNIQIKLCILVHRQRECRWEYKRSIQFIELDKKQQQQKSEITTSIRYWERTMRADNDRPLNASKNENSGE